MAGKKTIFIIPGYRQVPTQKAYLALSEILKSEGYEPILVTIPWKKTTISENTEYFLKTYNKAKVGKKYILGFSFGAMIAFLAATKISVDGLILCSLSPYFQEDLPTLSGQEKKFRSPIQADRYNDFSQLHFTTLAKKLKTKKIHLLYGSKEAKSLIKRVTTAFEQINLEEKYVEAVKSVEHNIGDKRYLQTIHQVAKQLN
jgi:esterase/lipase